MLLVSACGASVSSTPEAASTRGATPAPSATTVKSASPSPSPTPTIAAEPSPSPTPTITAEPTRSLTPTIAAAPSNDEPPGVAITTLPFVDTTNTTRAQIHAMELASPCGSGSQSVWYSFTAAADATLVADTSGSDYDTILDVWEGALTADRSDPGFEALKPLACNDNADGSVQSGVVFAPVAGRSYVIRVSTALDATGGTLVFRLSAG
jgi:hypothetical protein